MKTLRPISIFIVLHIIFSLSSWVIVSIPYRVLKMYIRLFLFMIYVFTIGVLSNNSPNSPPSFMKPLDQKLLFPYTTIFSKAINNRSIIECMKLSESTSFKIKNCTIKGESQSTSNGTGSSSIKDKSCLCYYIKLIQQECEELNSDQSWQLQLLQYPECFSTG